MTVSGRVVVRESIAEAGVELLRARGFDVVVDAESPARRAARRRRCADRPLRDQGDGGRSRAGAEAQGDRARGRGCRQRGRRRCDPTRDRGCERARVECRLGRRAHDRPSRRAGAKHPAGARGTPGGSLGTVAIRWRGARRQDTRRARLRPHRPAGRAARARPADESGRPRSVRLRGALPRARCRVRLVRRRSRARRLHHACTCR